MSATPNTAVYLRISQDRNGEALGVDRQRAACVELAERHGWTIGEVYTDNDESAYRNHKGRKEWRRMLEAIRTTNGVGNVVAFANDRLYRRVRDQLDLMEAVAASGGLIATVLDGDVNPSTAEGKMRMGILANVAEFEVERKSERQAAVIRERARQGKTNGGGLRPYGYKTGGLEIEPAEAEHVKEAARRIIAGESTYQIARDWRDRGIKTSTGGDWSHRLIRRTMSQSRIAGLREYEGELYPAAWPPVLPRKTWDAVQRRFAVRRKPGRPTGTRSPYVLTGFVYCGRCGHPMRGHPNHGKRSYSCLKDDGGCGSMRIIAEPTENVIAEAIFAAIDGGAVARALAAASKDADSAGLVEQVASDRAALDELAKDHYVERSISREEFFAARAELTERIAKAEQALSRSEDTAVLAGVSSGAVARAAWAERDQDWRRELVGALIERVEVAPSTVYRFDPERIGILWKA